MRGTKNTQTKPSTNWKTSKIPETCASASDIVFLCTHLYIRQLLDKKRVAVVEPHPYWTGEFHGEKGTREGARY